MKCPKCEAEIPDKAKFCTKCGANIEELKVEKKAKEAEKAEEKKVEKSKKVEEKEADKKLEAPKEVEEKKEEGAKFEKVVESKKDSSKKKEDKKEDKKEEKAKEELKDDLKKELKKDIKKEVKKENKKAEKKAKKSHWKAKLITILIILLIIAFCISYFLYRAEMLPESVQDILLPVYEMIDGWLDKDEDEKDDKKQDQDEPEKEDDKEDEEATETKELKVDDYIEDLYNKEMFSSIYRLPKIKIDSDDAKAINDEIEDLLDKLDLKKLEKEKVLPEGVVSKVDYKSALNKEILSVVIYQRNYHTDEYHVYNINVKTGEIVDNREVLEAEKIDEDKFKTLCSEAVEDYYENYLYSEDIAKSAGQVYDDAKAESIDENNFRVSSTDMFLDENGRVNIIAEITTIAGAGYNDVIINIEKLKENSKNMFADETEKSKNIEETTNETSNTTNTTN